MTSLPSSVKALLAGAAFALSAAYAPMSEAAAVVINFEAIANGSNGGNSQVLDEGTTIRGTLSYDSTLTATDSSGMRSLYDIPGLLAFSVFDASGNLLTQAGTPDGQAARLTVRFNSPASGSDSIFGSLNVSGDSFTLPGTGLLVTPTSLDLTFSDPSMTWLDTGELPSSLGSAPIGGTLRFWYAGDGFGTGKPFTLTSVSLSVESDPSPVPTPGTFALLAAGLGVAGVSSRRRFKN